MLSLSYLNLKLCFEPNLKNIIKYFSGKSGYTERNLDLMLFRSILFLLLTISISCGKERTVLFTIPIDLYFEIPAGLNPFASHFHDAENIPTNYQKLKNQFNLSDDQKVRILPESAILQVIDRSENLSFLQEVHISIYDTFHPDILYDAFLTEDVPINANDNVFVVPFNDDLSELLMQSHTNFQVKLRTRTVSPSFLECRLTLNFSVE